MPNKLNDAVRHKFPKAKYRVTNWAEYNEFLRRRGDLTIWFDPGMLAGWHARGTRKRGGKVIYSDLAIELCLTLRIVFQQPLRQTQGLVGSLFQMMGVSLPVPDFSTLSRRGRSLNINETACVGPGPMTLIIDSTGLQVRSGRDWTIEKHGIKKPRKTWRKLHIGFDPDSGEIVTSTLTTVEIGDQSALPDLCASSLPVAKLIADGAYDGGPCENVIREAFGPKVEIVIPPPKNAVLGTSEMRNAHIARIATDGRRAWQTATGYTQRSRVEAQIGRYKAVIGKQLQSRKLETQKTEAKIAVKSLNRMSRIGRAVYERAS